MSLFSWLFSKPAPASSSALPADVPKGSAPRTVVAPTSVDPMAELKHQRHDRREQLYDVVRSVMLRSEVLASHYKFKVLSLDARGRQFLVMIDLLGEQVLPSERWLAVEQLIGMTAAQRHDLDVKGVYWRLMPAQVATAAAALRSTVAAQPVSAKVAEAGTVTAGARHGFDTIDNDEVMAFKRAIADAKPEEKLAAQSGRVVTSGPRKPAPQPGYEDTQLLEPDDASSPLSRTQFGGLD